MKFSLRHIIIALAAAMSAGCSDDVAQEAYYTFTGDTVASYCEERPDTYSIFTGLINDTGNDALLSTYGHYSCFIPDNAAFEAYFASVGKTYAELTDEEKKEIVYNHVIKSDATDFTSDRFEEGALYEPSMSNNYIVISYKTDEAGGGLQIFVNKDVRIVERDIEVHNGVIHRVSSVIRPTEEYITDVMLNSDELGGQSFSLFAEALKVTHLCDSIKRTFDPDYVCPSPTGIMQVSGWPMRVPVTKRYGYTVFAEPDAVMNEAGIRSLADLDSYARRYYDNGSDDYTSRDNALNKFVSYHILDRRMATNALLYSGACTAPNSAADRMEFYETMYTFRLLKINVGIALNRSERNKKDFVALDESRSNISAINGYIHSLRQMLVYDAPRMENDVLNCRIRFDVYNVPPELTNNNIRWQLHGMQGEANGYTVPPDFCGKHMRFSKETRVVMWASEGWSVHQADELKLNGWYDFTLRLLPVPPGSYELRVGYSPCWWRGIAQLFIDGQIVGIPRDLRIGLSSPLTGWQPDTGGPQDAENDKAMRNLGYMKAPASMWNAGNQRTLRDQGADGPLRMIIGTFTFQDYGEHFYRAKNVYSTDMEYNGDYIELIPTSLIDTEDIY
jgi:Secreted and surface protein containing fasciclin-like repeats